MCRSDSQLESFVLFTNGGTCPQSLMVTVSSRCLSVGSEKEVSRWRSFTSVWSVALSDVVCAWC